MDESMNKRILKSGVHTFVICAYKKSAYLEECIQSLTKQSVLGEIIMITSTPNEYIEGLASKYNIRLYVNTGEGGIAQDWNFGVSKCKSRYVTIAHQDDVYEEDYLKDVLAAIRRSRNPIITFTDYGEIRDGQKVLKSRMLMVKRLLLMPLRIKAFSGSRFVKRRVLSLGNPICCPSVTYCMERLKQPIFEVKYGSNLDWQTWAGLASQDGEFVYVKRPRMYHRIHRESTTSGLIENHERGREDMEMLGQFWPKPIAKLIGKAYSKGENLNK